MPKNQSSLMLILIRVTTLAAVLFSAGCGAVLKQSDKGQSYSSAFSVQKKGGYYLDDGPGDSPPPNLHLIPDAVPRDEPLRANNMRPYVALGKRYTPRISHKRYKERGIASWYGRRYHGQKTASGEVYDMYGMTAAHPVLPIPSYVRVTNIGNGKSVVVRINDRGPFLSDRLIDLSYTAAYKLDVLGGGSAFVEVETLLPGASSNVKTAATTAVLPPDAGSTPSSRVGSTSAGTREAAAPPASFVQESPDSEARPDFFDVILASADQRASSSQNAPAISQNGEGVYLQLGAFSAYDSADNFLSRMRAELPTGSDGLEIVAKDGLFKVHAGPYTDPAIAKRAAEKIAQTLSIKPILLMR